MGRVNPPDSSPENCEEFYLVLIEICLVWNNNGVTQLFFQKCGTIVPEGRLSLVLVFIRIICEFYQRGFLRSVYRNPSCTWDSEINQWYGVCRSYHYLPRIVLVSSPNSIFQQNWSGFFHIKSFNDSCPHLLSKLMWYTVFFKLPSWWRRAWISNNKYIQLDAHSISPKPHVLHTCCHHFSDDFRICC